ncbi:hypothetical protein ACQ4PT_006416 [Festuca glaucescens]
MVSIDDHIILPDLDPTATSANPDRALEDYVSSLSTLPMDHSRPLWELHVLDFPTSEAAAAAVLRVHHSVGDGVSLLSLFIACTRRASDQASLPALPTTGGRRAGPVYALSSRPRLSPSWGALAAFAAWVVSLLLLGGGRSVLRGDGDVDPGPPADAVQGRGGHGVPAKAIREPHAQPRRCQVRQERRKLYYKRCAAWSDFCRIVLVLFTENRRKWQQDHQGAVHSSCQPKKDAWPSYAGYYDGIWQRQRCAVGESARLHDTPVPHNQAQGPSRVRPEGDPGCAQEEELHGIGLHAAASLCYGMMRNTTLSFSNVAGPIELVVYIAPGSYGHPHALTMHYQSYANIIKLVLSVDEAQFPDAHDLLDDFDQSLRLIKEAASEKQKDTWTNVSQ